MVPLFVLDDDAAGDWATGGAARWWLHNSLAALDDALRARGSRLFLFRGDAVAVIRRVAEAVDAAGVHATEHFEPWARKQQAALADALDLTLHGGGVLAHPDEVRNGSGGPYKVFTPFWRALQSQMPPAQPAPAPEAMSGPDKIADALALDALDLLPTRPNWAAGFAEHWTPGETGAHDRLAAFAADAGADYANGRDLCARDATSRLSPHLHFGELSPAQIWHGVTERGRQTEPFLRQLGWRDFSTGLIYHSPDFASVNWKSEFDAFPWREDAAALKAWQRGETGYPIVDAGMRQLWQTGWMHNRVRMIAASFLIKHLLIDWRAGEAWFWDTLVDADLGNNAAGWQWVAGSGADASPFFRIFNPITQAEKFDPDGDYIRRWVPELADLPTGALAAPWQASPDVLKQAGVALGKTYPEPIVEHGAARQRALDAYDIVKQQK